MRNGFSFQRQESIVETGKSAVKLLEGLLVVVDPMDAVVPWVGFCFLEGFLFASSLGGRLHGERKVEVKYHALQIG